MVPDRVRAVAIDGVLDPVGWAGNQANKGVAQTQRIKSGEGAAKALHEILVRCGKAGPRYCMFAEYGDPVKSYGQIVASLKKEPLEIRDENTGEEIFTLTYADLTAVLLGNLDAPDGATGIDFILTAVCDEDSDRGGFGRRTANPVLFVGNYWDPATNYAGAVTAARLLPNSQLLSSISWGHTAYGTSERVTRAVGRYLFSVTLPDRGIRCVGAEQPFTQPLGTSGQRRPGLTQQLPPVVPPLPGALPRS